jgi:hypothetical protein
MVHELGQVGAGGFYACIHAVLLVVKRLLPETSGKSVFVFGSSPGPYSYRMLFLLADES